MARRWLVAYLAVAVVYLGLLAWEFPSCPHRITRAMPPVMLSMVLVFQAAAWPLDIIGHLVQFPTRDPGNRHFCFGGA